MDLSETRVSCPYCGERITIVVDCSVEEQQYIEDCFVCCRPINVHVFVTDMEASVSVSSENE
ncbi:MAG: CPXCG motif-containing cysteine-rich protein [Pseudomonadota bacterium]